MTSNNPTNHNHDAGSAFGNYFRRILTLAASRKAITIALVLIASSIFSHVAKGGTHSPSYLDPTPVILTIVGLIVLAKLINSVETRRMLIRPGIEDLIVVTLLVWMWVSIPTADAPTRSFELSLQASLLVMAPYFLVRLLVRDRTDLLLMLRVISVLGALVGVTATASWLIEGNFLVENTAENRATFFSTNPVPTAISIFAGAVAAAGLMVIDSRRPTLPHLLMFAASTGALFFTGTRSTLLAAVLLVALAVALYIRHKMYRRAGLIAISAFITIGTFVVVGVALAAMLKANDPANVPVVRQYFFPTVSRWSHLFLGSAVPNRRLDNSTISRLSIWTGAFDRLFPSSTPVPGIEPSPVAASTPTSVPTVRPTATAIADPTSTPDEQPSDDEPALDRTPILEQIFESTVYRRTIGNGVGSLHPPAHNIFIETAIETGVVGLGLISLLLGIIAYKSVTRLNRQIDPYILALLMFGAGLIVIKQLSSTMLGNRDLFITIAMFVSLINMLPKQLPGKPLAEQLADERAV